MTVVNVVKYGSVLKKKKSVAKERHQGRTLIKGMDRGEACVHP